jgi:hypothetical protein
MTPNLSVDGRIGVNIRWESIRRCVYESYLRMAPGRGGGRERGRTLAALNTCTVT